MTARSTPAARLGRALCALWSGACLVVLVLLIAGRALTYTTWFASPAVDRVLRELMVLEQQSFFWSWVTTTALVPQVLAVAVLVAIAGHRRALAALVTRTGGVWRLTPVAVAIVATVMLWLHFLFDLNPTVGIACATSLVLAAIVGRVRTPTLVGAALWAVFFAAWMLVARDAMDRLALVAWALVLAGTQRLAAHVGRRELSLLRVLAVVPMNLLPAVMPLVLPVSGGTRLGDGLGYGFCDVPGRPTVYATVPVCDSIRTSYEECRHGRVVEYDKETAAAVAEHRFFSPDFYGRLELAECLDDEVQVSVQSTVLLGRNVVQTAMAFPIADPRVFNPSVAGEGMGITIAHDRAHRALLYMGEFTHRIVRLDRATGRLEEVGGEALARRWTQPILLRQFTGSSIAYTGSIHPGRNRLYVGEFMQGRRAWGIDLTTLQAVVHYDIAGGGAAGMAVDAERDRLLVSSLWGIEVFDLATGRVLMRRRMGLGSRSVVVDAARNRLYVGSTVEGKLRILDRDTLDVVGQIAVGIGTRFPYLSTDGRDVYASSVAAHYRWNADALASAD